MNILKKILIIKTFKGIQHPQIKTLGKCFAYCYTQIYKNGQHKTLSEQESGWEGEQEKLI